MPSPRPRRPYLPHLPLPDVPLSSAFPSADEPERILVVDDDAGLRRALATILNNRGYITDAAADGSEALERLRARSFDLVVTDVRMPVMGGEALLSAMRQAHPVVAVIAISAYSSNEVAASLTRSGAADVLSKPVHPELLVSTVRRVLEESRPGREAARARLRIGTHLQGIVGRSAPMRRLFDLIGRIARSPAPVLITGETGTGKELVARAVHLASGRDPFVAVNCAAIPEKLLESELFGHVRGAFTGAHAERKGLFEQASGGTLLLDEIGELPVTLQAKLLRAIQFGEIRRVGESDTRRVDLRVLAATHQDLAAAVERGGFRADLYYRINVLRLEVPPLRSRPPDIPLLTEHFLADLARRDGREVSFSSAALAALVAYGWPGNVRQLRQVVEVAALLSDGPEVTIDDLPPEIAAAAASSLAADHPPRLRPLAEVEREHILAVLEAVGGNRSRAAEALGVPRRTLYRRLSEYGVLDRSD
jgi:DNA-binding NtrC family response regulator